MAVIRRNLDATHFSSGKASSVTLSKPIQPTFVSPPYSKKKGPSFFGKFVRMFIILLLIGILSLAAYQWWQSKYGSVLGRSSSVLPIIVGKAHLSKDETGLTNVLIVGIDTREKGTVELNTDTIILASYNEDTNRLAMLSFPRDFAVPYAGYSEGWRINAIYAQAENKAKGTGLSALQKVVEDISGKSVQYVIMVDLKGFTDAISVVGGVDVYLDYDLSGEYPTPWFSYERVAFTKGWNHFTGEQALKYSRMRKNMSPASEEGDFARAKRQQKVIQALIDKLSKTETLQDPSKLWGLLNTFKKNITISRITIEDIQAGVSIIKEKGKPQAFSYVLDFNAGGSEGRLVDMVSYVPYLIGPRLGLGKYSEIKQFITQYFDEPALATSSKKIIFINGGAPDFDKTVAAMKVSYYYAHIEVGTALDTPVAQSYMTVVDDKQSASIAEFLGKKLTITDIRKGTLEEYKNTALVVVLGENYR